ncbi:uncharacterized protein LOC123504768 isoform X3 [Portunus trituberculatus]|uniref:uncharacterized protein LOC123504768 isoform X3 n=1 Tax=Portunus trituberculatus TaxID=210409 RepID=UPI001E1CFB8B|nr:uncharacterized protein LOC123504768 isoform X3 [Portunus trituberculatus]
MIHTGGPLQVFKVATCMLKRITATRFSEWPGRIHPTMICGKDNDTYWWSSSGFQDGYLHAEENCCCKILSGPGGFTQLWFVDRTMIHTGGPLQVFKMATCMLKRIAAARFSVAQEDSPNYGLLDGQ